MTRNATLDVGGLGDAGEVGDGSAAGEHAAVPASAKPRHNGVIRALGLGLITGAADDDCSAIGTYAAAGAKIGPSFLWTAPVTFPMMFAVVYLSAKLGQVSGRGLFHVIRDYYLRWILWASLAGVLPGNTWPEGWRGGCSPPAWSRSAFLPCPS